MALNLYGETVSITKTASQLLFEGYQDGLIDMAREMAQMNKDINVQVPDRFGWFYKVR